MGEVWKACDTRLDRVVAIKASKHPCSVIFPGIRFNNMRESLNILLLCLMAVACAGQSTNDWQSLAKLQPGDNVRVTSKTGATEGAFRTWTLQDVTVGTVTARKEDVVKVVLRRPSGSGRGKHALIGGLIGFGGGFAFGAAIGGCSQQQIGFCIGRGTAGAVAGTGGAAIGAIIGALIPRHNTVLIYAAK